MDFFCVLIEWMDYWEIFDLFKSKFFIVFDIGCGIFFDNLNIGVVWNIVVFDYI